MVIYYFFIVYLIIMIFYYDYCGIKRKKNIFINISVIYLVCLVGFRFRMGTDTITYMNSYDICPTIFNITTGINEHYSPLFVLLMSLVKTFTNEFWVFQFIVSLFVNIVFVRTIRFLFGDDFIFTFLLIFFTGQYFAINCESLRESIAIAIFFLSLKSLFCSDWKRYYLFCLIAIGFHYGAVILLIIPLIKNLRINLYLIILFLVLILLSNHLLSFFSSFLLTIPFVTNHINELLILYIDSSREAGVDKVNINYYVIGVLLPVVCCFVTRKLSPQYSKYEFLIIIYIISKITCQVLSILYRYQNYVCLIYYALYAACIHFLFYKNVSTNCQKKRKLAPGGFIMYLILVFPIVYVSISLWKAEYLENYQRYILIDPYTSIFEKNIDSERESLYQFIGRY